MIDHRPDSDLLLAHVQEAQTRQARGKLKIFLGYAAGVGKTYSMLEAAHQRLAEGSDVVVAYIDTHGRHEAQALLEGLEIIPRRYVTYRDVTSPEMNLDAVLARRPQIALVDGLAHTNGPSSRHAKRYQDVLELLAVGIDVYTTLNIQHVESLNDVVTRITGVVVQDTLPDRILDEADEIELVDLPTDELLQRLSEGKVYIPESAKRTAASFFRTGNLTALRELALRRAADRVDEQMRAYMQTHAIAGPWAAHERVLVCVSPSPFSEKLVRSGRRLATRLNAEWYAAYVETPGETDNSEVERERLARSLRLAGSLGAKTVTLAASSVAEAIVPFARTHNITKIVIGKSLRSGWQELLRGSVINQVVRQSGDIDVYVISNEPGPLSSQTRAEARDVSRPAWGRYLQSVGLVLVATALGYPLRPLIEPTNLVMLYLVAVVVAALYLGRRAAMLVSVLSVAAFNFVFVPPYYTFIVANAEYLLTFVGLLVVGVVISSLAARARRQAQAAQVRATETQALYELSLDLAAAANMQDIAQTVVMHLRYALECPAAVLFPDESQALKPGPGMEGFELADDEQEVATWVWQHAAPAGRGNSTFGGANGLYLPLTTVRGVAAVLGVQFLPDDPPLLPQQRRLLEAFASQTAHAIERVDLALRSQEAELLREKEKLQTALLDSISHDLRTPLSSITGALSSLREDADYLDDGAREALVNTASEQADRLNRLVDNLLDMTRLESGAVKVKNEPCDLQDLIGVTLGQLEERIGQRQIEVDVPYDAPLVPLDFKLMVQVLVNLIDNALKYSPSAAPVRIKARVEEQQIMIEVVDWGIGIPDKALPHIFDKFYRVKRTTGASGTGLGLSIAKGLVEAHQGKIWARPNPEGGTIVALAIPLQTAG
jgi:two-component system sensor histidine kinase KdpD